jgi:hypothetical protein
MDRRFRFVGAQVAWMLAVCVVLLAFDGLTVESMFVFSFIGFLIVIELTAPYAMALRWRGRLRWFVLLGLAGFGYLAVRQVLSILPS